MHYELYAPTFPIQPPADEGTDIRMPDTVEISASKISVPMQMFLAAVGTAIVLGGAFYQATGGVRSRLDVMAAKQDSAAELSKLRDDNTKAQLDAMKDDMKSLRGKADLLQLQQQQLQLELVAMKGQR